MAQALSINRLVSVGVNLSPLAAAMQNISTLLILGSSNVIDVVERIRSYTTLAAVAADFGTTAPEYLAASLYYQQSPQPTQLKIGRWASTATAGVLKGGALSTAQQLMSAWTGITDGAFKISVDGVLKSLTTLSFAAQTNLNGVASVIQTALVAAGATGATVVWNASFSRFEVQSGTTGATSTVSFATSPAGGTDLSGLLGLTAVLGAYAAPGQALETAVTAVSLFDNNFGQGWYGLFIAGAQTADHIAVSAFIEGSTNKHLYGVSTQDPNVLSSISTTDIAYQLQQRAPNRTTVQYSSSSPYAVCSLFGRILTVDYNGNNTTITLMYKQEPGIAAETLNATQVTALEAKNCNVFVAYNNNTAIIEKGVVSSGEFLDTITGTDWLALDIQTTVFNLLYTSQTKIPQTDAGTNLLVTAIEGRCAQGVVNGLLAPGVWGVQGFGALNQGDFLSKGFYVYAPPVSTQTAADRAARKSVPIQVAAKLAGAIHTVNVTVNVNR